MNAGRSCHITWEESQEDHLGETSVPAVTRISRGTLQQEVASKRRRAGGVKPVVLPAQRLEPPQRGGPFGRDRNLDVLTSPFRALAESCGFKVIREDDSSCCSDGNSEMRSPPAGSSNAGCSLKSDREGRGRAGLDKNDSCTTKTAATAWTRRGTPGVDGSRADLSVSSTLRGTSSDEDDDGEEDAEEEQDLGRRQELSEPHVTLPRNPETRRNSRDQTTGSDLELRGAGEEHARSERKHGHDASGESRKSCRAHTRGGGTHEELRTRGASSDETRSTRHRHCNHPGKNMAKGSVGQQTGVSTRKTKGHCRKGEGNQSVSAQNEDQCSADGLSPDAGDERSSSGTYRTVQEASSPDEVDRNSSEPIQCKQMRRRSEHCATDASTSCAEDQGSDKASCRREEPYPKLGRQRKIFMETVPGKSSCVHAPEEPHMIDDSDKTRHIVDKKRASIVSDNQTRGHVERTSSTLAASTQPNRTEDKKVHHVDREQPGEARRTGRGAAFRISRRSTSGSKFGVMRYFRPQTNETAVNLHPEDTVRKTDMKAESHNSCDMNRSAANLGGGDGRVEVDDFNMAKIKIDTSSVRETKSTAVQCDTIEVCLQDSDNSTSQAQGKTSDPGVFQRDELQFRFNMDDKSKYIIRKGHIQNVKHKGDSALTNTPEHPETQVLSEISKLRGHAPQNRSESHWNSFDGGGNTAQTVNMSDEGRIHRSTTCATKLIEDHSFHEESQTCLNDDSQRTCEKGHHQASLVSNNCEDRNLRGTFGDDCQETSHNYIHLHGYKEDEDFVDTSQQGSVVDQLDTGQETNLHQTGPFRSCTQEDRSQGNHYHPDNTRLHSDPHISVRSSQQAETACCARSSHQREQHCHAHIAERDIGEHNARDEGNHLCVGNSGDVHIIQPQGAPNVNRQHCDPTNVQRGSNNGLTIQLPRMTIAHGLHRAEQIAANHHHKDFGFNVNSNYECSEEGEGAVPGSRFIGQYFLELWKNQCLCDVRLRVGNWSYLAHKIVLAAFSDYFCPNDPHCMPSICFDIPNATPDSVHQILLYLYTSEMEITDYTLESVLCAAESLGVSEVINLVKEILENPTPENFEHYLEILNRHGFQSRLTDYTELIREHLLDLTSSTYFQELDLCDLQQILGDPEVKVDSECDIIDVIARWIEYSPLERIAYSADLLSFVNFDCIPADSLADVVERKRHVFSRDAFSIFLDAFKTRSLTAECQPITPTPTMWTPGGTSYTPKRPLHATNKSTNADSYRPPLPPPPPPPPQPPVAQPVYDTCDMAAAGGIQSGRGPFNMAAACNSSNQERSTSRRDTSSRLPRSSQSRISALLGRPSSGQHTSAGRPGSTAQSWPSEAAPPSRPSTAASSRGSEPHSGRVASSSGPRRFATTQSGRTGAVTPREIMAGASRGDCENSSWLRSGKQHRIIRSGGGGGGGGYAARELPAGVPSDSRGGGYSGGRGSVFRGSNGNAIPSPASFGANSELDFGSAPQSNPTTPPASNTVGVGVAPIWEDGTAPTSPASRHQAPPTSPGNWWRSGSRGSSPASCSFVGSPWAFPGPGEAPPPAGCSTFRVVRGRRGPRWEQRSRSPSAGQGSRDRSSSKRVTFM